MTKTILALLLWGAVHTPGHAQSVITKTVCANGCDYPDPETAELSLPASLSSTYIFLWQAGQSFQKTLTIRKLAMNGNSVIHRSSQSYALPAGVRAGAANLANMATLITPPGAPALMNEQGASYHRFEGLEIRSQTNGGYDPFDIVFFGYQLPGSPGLSDNQRSDLAHHIVFDRCYIHHWLDPIQGSGFATTLYANTGYLELTNSTVMAFSPTNEAHAVGAYNGEGPFVFQNNAFISSQIGSIFGGGQPTITGIRARSVSFLGNYYYRPWLWRVTSGTVDPSGACQWDANGGESYNQTASGHWWLCVSGAWSDQGVGTTPIPYYQSAGASLDKNQFEIKNGWGFTVQGNVLQNGWQPAMLGQKGACVLLNQVDDTGLGDYEPQATIFGLQFTNNACDSTGHGIDVGVIGGPYNHTPDQITFSNNLFTNIGLANIVGAGYFDANLVEIHNSLHYTYDHNTLLLNNTSSAGALGYGQLIRTGSVAPFGPPGVLTWTNNIAVQGFWGLYDEYDGQGATNRAIPFDYPNANIQSSIVITAQTAICNPGGSGNCGQAEWAGACLNCYFPTSFSSVFQNYPSNLAVNATYAKKGTLGTDPGVNLVGLQQSTQGTLAGTANPALNFRVRSMLVRDGGADFTYSAPDTGACTLTVSEDSGGGSPVYSASDGGGNPDRSVTVAGLGGRARYWWNMVCGASGYRLDGAFITR